VQAPPEITHRTKAPNSLRDKLVYRATNEKEYNSLDDIKADIVGACGAGVEVLLVLVAVVLVTTAS